MRAHVTTLGLLNLLFGLLLATAATLLFTRASAPLAATASAAAAIPHVLIGAGLLRRRPWSRALAILLSVFQLLVIPIGTFLGVYALWVLSSSSIARAFTPTPRERPAILRYALVFTGVTLCAAATYALYAPSLFDRLPALLTTDAVRDVQTRLDPEPPPPRSPSRARNIYRAIDDDGTVHITNDLEALAPHLRARARPLD